MARWGKAGLVKPKCLQNIIMPNIIYEYETETGETVSIEAIAPVETTTSSSITRGGRRENQDATPEVKKVKVSFEKALGTVKAAAQGLKNVIRETSPDEAQVEFSLKASGEAGLFAICRAETAAEFKVTLTWKSSKASNT